MKNKKIVPKTANQLRKIPDLPYFKTCTKKQGEFTLDDYDQIPEGFRTELIDGVFYEMPSPTSYHQSAIVFLCGKLQSFINVNNFPCRIMLSPFDVQLDCDDKTMIQPDLTILCDKEKLTETHIYGAPDFVLEVILSENKWKDMIIKLEKYMYAGVREYWILEIEQNRLTVYDFEHNEYPMSYSIDDTVPVSVLDNQCEISLKELFEQLDG